MYLIKNYKSPFYQIVCFINGKRTTISTKTGNYREAIRVLNSLVVEPLQELPAKKHSISITKFKDEYIAHIEPTKSISYIRSVKLSFKMLIAYAGDFLLRELDTHTIDKFITHTFARTPRGASLYYRTLKAAFSKAVLWNYISENPLKKIKSPKVSKSFPIFISEAELHTILGKTKEEYLRNIFFTAFYTGMRLGELVNMKWSWIDLNEKQIVVQCTDAFTTKSKKERIIPFSQNLKVIMNNQLNNKFDSSSDTFVFTDSRGKKLNGDYVSKKFKEAVLVAELDERIHFHTLRHSFASLLVQKGVSLYVVKELLGHEALTTTQIYSHLQQQNLRDAVNLI
jgi:site-specific recombinase XerD